MRSITASVFGVLIGVFLIGALAGACASDPLGTRGARVELGADASLWDSAVTDAATRLVRTRSSLALGREAGRELLGIDAAEGLELALKSIEPGPHRREACGRTPGLVEEEGAWLIAPGDRITLTVHNKTERAQQGWLVELPGDGESAVELSVEAKDSVEGTFVLDRPGPVVLTIVPTSDANEGLRDVGKRHRAVENLLARRPGRVLLREYAIAKHLSRPDLAAPDRSLILRTLSPEAWASRECVDRAPQREVLGLLTAALVRHPPRTGLVLYSGNDAALKVTVASASGHAVQATVQMSLSKRIALTSQLRAALGVQQIVSARAPVYIGDRRMRSSAVPLAMPSSVVSLEVAIGRVTDLVFPPAVRAKLEEFDNLVVLPTGLVATLPLAALTPREAGEPLVERWSVQIAPSLSAILDPPRRWNGVVSRALVFGDPKTPPQEEWRLPGLDGAREEALEVAPLLGVKARIEGDATRQFAIEQLPKVDVAWFATHGVAHPDKPLRGSFLALAGPNARSANLTAMDVLDLQLGNTQLVVLSACQTGLGQVRDGGVIGLARAFFLAGVPRTVVSLWSVNDAATLALMTAFVREFETARPAVAMQRAMLSLRQRYPAPAHWASFIVFGTGM